MLSADRKYIVQLVDASNGTRSEPIISDPVSLKNYFADFTPEELDSSYILFLADISQDINPQECVNRFPLYRLSSYMNLDVTQLTLPIEEKTNA